MRVIPEIGDHISVASQHASGSAMPCEMICSCRFRRQEAAPAPDALSSHELPQEAQSQLILQPDSEQGQVHIHQQLAHPALDLPCQGPNCHTTSAVSGCQAHGRLRGHHCVVGVGENLVSAHHAPEATQPYCADVHAQRPLRYDDAAGSPAENRHLRDTFSNPLADHRNSNTQHREPVEHCLHDNLYQSRQALADDFVP